MDLDAATCDVYLRRAFAQMLQIADRLGDIDVNRRPPGPHTNSVAALIAHCCGVVEFWLGHVALDRPNARDRDAEFAHRASVAELHRMADAAVAQAVVDVGQLETGVGGDVQGLRTFLPGEAGSDASIVLHVLEECYQHLGQMEGVADALAAGFPSLEQGD